MNNLIIIGHPDQNSFCYNGIFKTIKTSIESKGQELKIIDLYSDSFTRPRTKLIEAYKDLISWSENIFIISPVWWFRLTPRAEIFFDEVFSFGIDLFIDRFYFGSSFVFTFLTLARFKRIN